MSLLLCRVATVFRADERSWDPISRRDSRRGSSSTLVRKKSRCWTISWTKEGTTNGCWIYSLENRIIETLRSCICQDLFPPGKYAKTISRNAHYLFVFKNPRDQSGFRAFTLQAFPDRWRDVLRVFEKCTQRPYGYIMRDLHPASDDRYRLFSCVTQSDGPTQVWKRE